MQALVKCLQLNAGNFHPVQWFQIDQSATLDHSSHKPTLRGNQLLKQTADILWNVDNVNIQRSFNLDKWEQKPTSCLAGLRSLQQPCTWFRPEQTRHVGQILYIDSTGTQLISKQAGILFASVGLSWRFFKKEQFQKNRRNSITII